MIAEYDKLFDELTQLEKATGIILANSPTQTVGYTPVSVLEKKQHGISLLSQEKTKAISKLLSFARNHATLLMHKLDGLSQFSDNPSSLCIKSIVRPSANLTKSFTDFVLSSDSNGIG